MSKTNPDETPAEEPPGKPSEEPPEEPPGKPSEEPPGKPSEEPPGKPSEEPPGKPSEEPPGKPSEEPPEKPSEEPPEEPPGEPSEDVAEPEPDMLDLERAKTVEYEEKLKRALADYDNLSRKTQSDIEGGIRAKIDEFVLDLLKIHDDFVRAITVFAENGVKTDGLDSILKNMDSMLKKYGVSPIDALGEIFDPNLHEAVSVVDDPDLDDGTIVREIRKGYISHNLAVRPSLVEISKRSVKWLK